MTIQSNLFKTPTSSNPTRDQLEPHTTMTMPVVDKSNSLSCATWRDHVIHDQDVIYPSPPASHETVTQEALSSVCGP